LESMDQNIMPRTLFIFNFNLHFKRLLKTAGFIILFIAAYSVVNSILLDKTEYSIGKVRRFYSLRKNSLDVVFVGSSHIHTGVNPAIIWQEQGIPSFDLSLSSQPFWNSYYYIKEIIKHQKPKVVVLDVFAVIYSYTRDPVNTMLAKIYQNTYGMNFSLNKVCAIHASSSNNLMDFLLGFPIYHSRRNITKNDFVDPYERDVFMNGYVEGGKNATAFDIPRIIGTTEVEPIQEKQLEYLDKIIQFTKTNNVNLVLIKTPMAQVKDNSISLTEQNQKRLNYVSQMADDNAVQFINYNLLYNELQLDFKTDMRDIGHLNNYGAAKLSRHLAMVLADKYGLPDRRNDPAYADWNIWAEQVMEKLSKE
jgi:hypothetical protein